MSDYSLARIEGTKGPIWLPRAFVRDQVEQLAKAQKLSAGRIFSDYRHIQTGLGPGLQKPPESLPFDVLRQMADKSPIDRIIIDTRIMQMKRVARRALTERGPNAVGFMVRHVRHDDPEFDVPEGLKDLAKQIEDVLKTPTKPFHASTRDFWACAIEEELTIDRKVMVIARDRRGRPVRYHLIDGATVRPVAYVIFEEIQKQSARGKNVGILSGALYDETLMRLSEIHDIDLTSAAYIQLVDESITGAWREEDICVDITNPSVRVNQWGFGKSLLEKSHGMTLSFLKAWNYNNELFNLNYPEAILAVIGEYDENGLKTFKRKVLGEGDAVDNNWRLPVIPLEDKESDIRMVKLRDTPKDMLFMEFLNAVIRLKCASFRMHPSMINFSQDSGSGQIVFNSAADEESVITQSQEEGYHTHLQGFADWMDRTIVTQWHPDLRFVWTGLDQEGEDAIVERLTKEQQAYKSTNEVRAERGLKPMPKGIPTEPGDMIGSYQQAVQILLQQQQQSMQQGGDGYDSGDFGQEDDDQEQPGQQQQPPGQQPQQPPGGQSNPFGGAKMPQNGGVSQDQSGFSARPGASQGPSGARFERSKRPKNTDSGRRRRLIIRIEP